MPRPITLAGAQLGPVHKTDSRKSVVKRLCELLRRAHDKGAHLAVFPELALTTFFPRWFMADQAEVDTWFETEMPSAETKPLFDLAAGLKVGFYLAGPFRIRAELSLATSGKTLFRGRQSGIPGLAHHGRSHGHVHLQRPPLAGDLPRYGPERRRGHHARL